MLYLEITIALGLWLSSIASAEHTPDWGPDVVRSSASASTTRASIVSLAGQLSTSTNECMQQWQRLTPRHDFAAQEFSFNVTPKDQIFKFVESAIYRSLNLNSIGSMASAYSIDMQRMSSKDELLKAAYDVYSAAEIDGDSNPGLTLKEFLKTDFAKRLAKVFRSRSRTTIYGGNVVTRYLDRNYYTFALALVDRSSGEISLILGGELLLP